MNKFCTSMQKVRKHTRNVCVGCFNRFFVLNLFQIKNLSWNSYGCDLIFLQFWAKIAFLWAQSFVFRSVQHQHKNLRKPHNRYENESSLLHLLQHCAFTGLARAWKCKAFKFFKLFASYSMLNSKDVNGFSTGRKFFLAKVRILRFGLKLKPESDPIRSRSQLCPYYALKVTQTAQKSPFPLVPAWALAWGQGVSE